MGFGERLKELRDEKGITQKELGKIINISDRVIGYYEANNRFPKDEYVLKKLADFFEVSIDYLVDHTSNRVPPHNRVAEIEVTYGFDFSDLPDEAIKSITHYIDLIKLKYSTQKNKDNNSNK